MGIKCNAFPARVYACLRACMHASRADIVCTIFLVCMHVHLIVHVWQVCARVCIRACMRPCVHASVHACVRACMRPCVRATLRPFVCPFVCASVRPCVQRAWRTHRSVALTTLPHARAEVCGLENALHAVMLTRVHTHTCAQIAECKACRACACIRTQTRS